MLKALIKKQFQESFRSYFVSRKTGKRNPAWKIALLFVAFAFALSILCALSFGVSFVLVDGLSAMNGELDWLVFALMGAGAILFGVFGSVFNTYASLYLPKDNEFLLSMPIKPSNILLSRLLLVYLLSLLYSGIVWVPAVVCYSVFGHASVMAVLSGILLTFVIALFVMVITCALGWLVALIATRLRSKSILMVFLCVSFFLLYYYVCFNMSSLMEQLIRNITVIGGNVQKYAGMLYVLGRAGTGCGIELLGVCGVTVLLTALCLLVMTRKYGTILLKKPQEKKKAGKAAAQEKTRGVYAALLNRELKRLMSSTTYMMNCCFGIILMPIFAVTILLNTSVITEYVSQMQTAFGFNADFLGILVPAMIGLIDSMNCISLPSVSLEGKNLWILQTMPVPGWKVLRAKRDLHILLNVIPAVLLCVVVDLCLGVSLLSLIAGCILIVLFVWFSADLGLFLGIRHVDLKWTSETVVIKQNMFVLVAWVACTLVAVLTGVGGYFLGGALTIPGMIAIVSVVLLAVVLLEEKWLREKGSAIFEKL